MSREDRLAYELTLLFRDRRHSLLVQVDVIGDYRRGLVDADRARESAHRLAGTLGLFGFSELGREASRIELDLSERRATPDALLDDFIERLTVLLNG
ncbi:MAG: hypothetical protein RLZZ269_299 [Actinomycetota bacterium]